MPTGKRSPASNHQSADPLPDQVYRTEQDHLPVDRLVPAGWLVGIAMAAVMLCLLTLTYDEVRAIAPQQDYTAQTIRVIGLNELALTPSGRPERRPAPLPTPLDWRYLPTLPQQNPGLLPLLHEDQLISPQATP